MSGHDPIVALQVHLGQWPSFTGMEHVPPHARAVYMATVLVREVAGVITGSSFLNFFQAHVFSMKLNLTAGTKIYTL